MYSLKGFVGFSGFPNNTPGSVAKIGELSSYCYTYSKEKGEYTDSNYPDVKLISFSSKLADDLVSVPDAVKDNVFKIVGWLYGQVIATSNTHDRTSLLNSILNTFSNDASEVDSGLIVVDDHDHYIPEWLSWRIPNTENYIRVWFADDSFKAQYDEFEIVVVPALETLNNFFLTSAQVQAKLNAVSTSNMVDRIQQAKQNYPETIVKVETYDYVAPNNTTFTVPTRWGILIYGAAGNNVDNIKDALVKYILAHSTHTRDEWVAILPDLFKRTEFIFTPLWNKYAIPNRVLEAGIYAPIIKYSEALPIAVQTATEYALAHVKSYISFLTHPYKSLGVIVLGGPENRGGKFYFSDFYSDFIAVNTSSIDFNRMSADTQEVATILADLIYHAESVDKYTVLPFGMSKLIRKGILYVVKSVNNIQLLVVAKINYSTLPAPDPIIPDPIVPAISINSYFSLVNGLKIWESVTDKTAATTVDGVTGVIDYALTGDYPNLRGVTFGLPAYNTLVPTADANTTYPVKLTIIDWDANKPAVVYFGQPFRDTEGMSPWLDVTGPNTVFDFTAEAGMFDQNLVIVFRIPVTDAQLMNLKCKIEYLIDGVLVPISSLNLAEPQLPAQG